MTTKLKARRKDDRILCGRCATDIAAIVDDLPAFGPGWLPRERDKVWDLTAHAEDQMRRGKPPMFKRGRRTLGGTAQPHNVPDLPCEAKCPYPSCGMINLLDGSELGITRMPGGSPTAERGRRGQRP